MELNEQVVLVTGGSRGLGAAIAKAFGREGAKVVVNYHSSEDQANQIVAEIGKEKAVALQGDIRKQERMVELFAEAREYFNQPISTIINNALIDFIFDGDDRNKLDTIAWKEFQTQVEGSVQGALHTLQAGLEAMVKQNFGRIINIGTNLVQHPVVPYHDYNTAKAALLGFTRSMAEELGANGITVNMVSGGLLQTTDASSKTPDEVFELIKQSTPLRKVTTPEDVADAVLFFASPWSRAVTGQNLIVDGGLVKV